MAGLMAEEFTFANVQRAVLGIALIKQDKILIGGEESAGLSIRKHVPEKDGVLAGLFCCEMVARRGVSLGKQRANYLPKLVPSIRDGRTSA